MQEVFALNKKNTVAIPDGIPGNPIPPGGDKKKGGVKFAYPLRLYAPPGKQTIQKELQGNGETSSYDRRIAGSCWYRLAG